LGGFANRVELLLKLAIDEEKFLFVEEDFMNLSFEEGQIGTVVMLGHPLEEDALDDAPEGVVALLSLADGLGLCHGAVGGVDEVKLEGEVD
jgi:hypothetical protein